MCGIHRPWGQGGDIRGIYKYDHNRDENRMSHRGWLPKDGDLCVCIAHSGDYFSNYIVMKKTKERGKVRMVGKFGAYNFGKKVGTLRKKNFHLLQAGEIISYPQ